MEAVELKNYTYKDYLEIDKTTPDSERYELIFGEIYMMSGASKSHQDTVLNMAYFFKTIQKKIGCETIIAPYDLKFECDNTINIVQPDIMMFCKDEDVPCLVVEVLSPSTAYKDKGVKRELYECVGIKNYLIADAINLYVDKFVLEDKKLQYKKTYGKNDKMFLECINEEADVKEFLKDKRLESI